jgi:hypothetical protein
MAANNNILYCLVARDTVVLAEHRYMKPRHHVTRSPAAYHVASLAAQCNLWQCEFGCHEDSGETVPRELVSRNCSLAACRVSVSFRTDARSLFPRRVSYTQEQHMFHVLIHEGITFLCVTEQVRPEGAHNPDQQLCHQGRTFVAVLRAQHSLRFPGRPEDAILFELLAHLL